MKNKAESRRQKAERQQFCLLPSAFCLSMIPHSIRLRHPWDELPESEAGKIVYRRRFQRPTNLDAWERVTLEIDRAICSGNLQLNGARLGQLQAGEFFSVDITDQLTLQNELLVETDPRTRLASIPATQTIYVVEPDEPLGSPIGDVRLVIRAIRP
jgi:hypothetical protein